jgi:prolyl-tRNA editing enzyme YbaK/EbsC (Cys-tRNA(Pro) deacylase)
MPSPPPTGSTGVHPLDPEAAADRVRAQLDAVGVPYEIISIDPAYAATADFCARYGFSEEASANCIVVAGRADPVRYAACVVQATRRLDVNGTVRRRLGVRKASFAPPGDTVALTGMLPNGVTPLGLPDRLPIWVDEPVLAFDRIILGGGGLDTKVLVSPDVFHHLPAAEIVAALSTPKEPA